MIASEMVSRTLCTGRFALEVTFFTQMHPCARSPRLSSLFAVCRWGVRLAHTRRLMDQRTGLICCVLPASTSNITKFMCSLLLEL